MTTAREERVWPARAVWAAAVAAALAGIALSLWRPVAPPVGGVAVPQEQFDRDVLDTVAAYRDPRLWAASLLLVAEAAVVVVLAAWRPVRTRLQRLAGPRHDAVVRGGLVASAVVVATTVVTAPLAFWLSHVHRVAWGFRTDSAAGWLRDVVVALAIEAVVVGIGAAGLLVVIRRGGRAWPAWATLVGTFLTAALVVVQPLVIEPLFLPTAPLDDEAVRTSVEDVLDRAGIEADLLVGRASLRTTNVNAYVAGLGPTRRVVLYDTLLDLPPDQVAAVVAHELAHREHDDIGRGVALSAAGLLGGCLVLAWFLRRRAVLELSGARGPADPRLVPVIAAAVAVMTLAALPASNLVSRRGEAAADARALELTRDPDALVHTFRTFVVRDLAPPQPTFVGRLLFGTHPTPAERIRAVVTQARERGLTTMPLERFVESEADLRHPRIGARAP